MLVKQGNAAQVPEQFTILSYIFILSKIGEYMMP